MRRIITHDEFFSDQPEMLFIEDLKKPYHQAPLPNYGKRAIEDGEISVDGLYLQKDFKDENGLLDTAYADFERFTEIYGIGGKKFPVITKQVVTGCFEEYFVEVSAEAIIISANDTEGIRRGIYFVEDELIASEAPFLKPSKTHKIPYIKQRITRGFFSPTNRPPKNGDELSDDIDYYPDEYLNRLAHDGSNGIWIYTKFSDIIPSNVITIYGKGYEKRIEKLNRVCERCEKYGVGVYVFAIEPEGPIDSIAQQFKEIIGGGPEISNWQKKPICTHTEKGREYCIDAVKQLCEMVPKLKGYISITQGERVTSCAASSLTTCPHCGHIPRGESLAQTVDCLQEGIRRSGRKDVEFISWTYGNRAWDYESVTDYIKNVPADIKNMQNFEEMGYAEQLGRVRQSVDYWLSYPGPSELFQHTANEAIKYGKPMYAKMQICCSHEVATLPYIPSPGHIFEKFKGARKFNVTGVMECWYFGNYPSIMSKAAGELAFCDDYSKKDEFMLRLAAAFSGRSNAAKLAEAWKHFEEGYSNYPINIMFSYYGPMHDGVCWELSLKPRNFSPARTWLLLDKPNGDRINDALLCGHTLEEAIILIEKMRDEFIEGEKALEGATIPEEHSTVIKAFTVLAKSSSNILNFYKKREQLGLGEGDAMTLLSEMRELVKSEMDLSLQMVELCKQDSRLGYHSEAEGFKFFPKKLYHRIETLKELLRTEFVEVEGRIKAGLTPLEYYDGVEEDIPHYNLAYGDISKGEWVETGGGFGFAASYDDENLYLKLSKTNYNLISAEFKLFHPYPPLMMQQSTLSFTGLETKCYYSMFGERAEKELAKFKMTESDGNLFITVKRKDIDWTEDRPMKMNITVGGYPWSPEKPEEGVHSLGKYSLSPCLFGWFMPEKRK
ncbi:MAG: hypothetical protein E7587_03720 [Ruminococcaceae bacterium]|nr:hypothetical protein [Oscillospiraceae bacterium]